MSCRFPSSQPIRAIIGGVRERHPEFVRIDVDRSLAFTGRAYRSYVPGSVAVLPPPSVGGLEPARTRLSTPARLRIWAAALTVGALVLLAVTTTGMIRVSHRVAAIGGHDAPQAATASDVYFALNDLDAQAASLLMLGDDEAYTINTSVAFRTYQQRNAQLDLDLQQASRATASLAEQNRIAQLIAGLTLYRSWLSMALTTEQLNATQPAGHPPSASLGYYAEATTVLRTRLLPLAAELRRTNVTALNASFDDQRSTATWTIVSTLLIGAALVLALIAFQRSLARRHRRILNPAMALATACTIALVAGVCLITGTQTAALGDAQHRDIQPYLALTQAQAVTYDAAGDASRYLIEADPALIERAFTAKTVCLREGGACDPTTSLPSGGLTAAAGPSTNALWQAYTNDYAHAVRLAKTGDTAAAINVITGLSTGDGAIDLYRFNATMDRITTGHRTAYANELTDAGDALRYWPELPTVLIIVTIALIGLGIRPRLAEYR
jgi:hypothetical protein